MQLRQGATQLCSLVSEGEVLECACNWRQSATMAFFAGAESFESFQIFSSDLCGRKVVLAIPGGGLPCCLGVAGWTARPRSRFGLDSLHLPCPDCTEQCLAAWCEATFSFSRSSHWRFQWRVGWPSHWCSLPACTRLWAAASAAT